MKRAIYDEKLAQLHLEAREIFAHALQASSIPAAFDSHLHFAENRLIRHSADGGHSVAISLDDYQKIYVIALGKAALAMLDALLERLPDNLPLEGVCSAPELPRRAHPKIHYYAGGHPLPNEDSFRAAHAALRLLQSTGSTLVFFLISGGGSSLFEAPLDQRISFGDTVAFHRALVGAGATIREMNALRKHFSAVKGGRLAVAAAEAAKFSLLVSDVPPSDLDAVASGPTLPDPSTVEECREILARYGLLQQFPPRVREFFADPDLPETPGVKRALLSPHPHGFANSQLDTLLSNHDLVHAATERARALGYETVVDNGCDDWDYRDAAQYLLTRFRQLRREYPRLCLLSGGEVTVRLGKKSATGGRNQQFSLACALKLARGGLIEPLQAGQSLAAGPEASITVLSAGSDGVDGNSPAAGAIADSTTVARAQDIGLDAAGALRRFDSFPLFAALGDSVVTGPTNNNLRDLRIFLSR